MTRKSTPTPAGNRPSSVDTSRADAARRILHGLLGFPKLIPAWITFNALYAETGPERADLMAFIESHVSDDDAIAILRARANDVKYYASLPPGNMRLGPQHSAYRARAAHDLSFVTNESVRPAIRLAHLLAAVYQVRCNLFHGRKDVQDPRSRALVDAGYRIVNDVLSVVL